MSINSARQSLPCAHLLVETVKLRTTNYETSNAAFAIDQSGVIVLWNSAAEKTFGFPATAALGQSCWKLLAGKDVYGNHYCNKHCSVRKMAFRHKPANTFEASYKTAAGKRKQFTINSVTVFANNGDEMLLHICHPEIDITDNNYNSLETNNLVNCHKGTLTPREIETLALLADGLNTNEIASTLDISVSTARNHIHHVLHKLHVHTRLDAVLLGKQLSLI